RRRGLRSESSSGERSRCGARFGARGGSTNPMDAFRREPRELVFLLDEDVKALKPLFPKRRAKTLADLRLKLDSDDAAIVQIAWDRGFTLATANANHFRTEI